MNENEFEYEGKTYIAVPFKNCESCSMLRENECIGLDNLDIPNCYSGFRTDLINVHYEEKQ